MKLIDSELLEREINEKTSGYNERAKVILWDYIRILHRQKVQNFMSWKLWIVACIACLEIGFLIGRCG